MHRSSIVGGKKMAALELGDEIVDRCFSSTIFARIRDQRFQLVTNWAFGRTTENRYSKIYVWFFLPQLLDCFGVSPDWVALRISVFGARTDTQVNFFSPP